MVSRSLKLARQISDLERGCPQHAAETGRTSGPSHARVIGISGPPGVGKSVLVGQLASLLTEKGHSVAILLVDPSSPITGGAILADRLRLPQGLSRDNAFIRSLSNHGTLGGLSAVVPAVVTLFEAEGFDFILVETVGVGQNEIAIVNVAESIVVVQAPETGDEAQALKAGILEIADVLVVNKKDLGGSDRTVRSLKEGVDRGSGCGWIAPVVTTCALTGDGTSELLDALSRHGEWLRETHQLHARRRSRIETDLKWRVLQFVERNLQLEEIPSRIACGEMSFDDGVRSLIDGLRVIDMAR